MTYLEDQIARRDALVTATQKSGVIEAMLPTGGGSAVDQASIPQALGDATPGTSSLAAPADHVHPMPTLDAFDDIDMTGATDGQVLAYDSASGQIKPVVPQTGVVPLWLAITAGEITLPRGHTDDSGSYGSNPASGELRLSYFRAQNTGSRNTVRFQTGGGAAAGSTLARVGVYSVDEANGNLTLIASCTNKTTFTGTYSGQTCTLTTPAALTKGSLYAVGILQVATTPATVAGVWFNGTFMGASPKMARKLTGQTDLPASVTAGLADTQFPVYCELV